MKKQNNYEKKASLDKIVDDYLKAEPKYKGDLKRKISKHPKSKNLCSIIDERIKTSNVEVYKDLLRLGVSIDRFKYIKSYLDFIIKSKDSDEMNVILQQFQRRPLSSDEQLEVANHIVEYEDFDPRLLDFLNNDVKKATLDRIFEGLNELSLSTKYLDALCESEDYVAKLQGMIRNGIKKNHWKRRPWIKYLDLNILENQKLLDRCYTIFELHREFSLRPKDYVNSDIFSVRVAQHVAYREPINQQDWVSLKQAIISKVEVSGEISKKDCIFNFLEDLSYIDADYAETMLIMVHKKISKYTDIALTKLLKMASGYAYQELINCVLTTDNVEKRNRVSFELIKYYPQKGESLISYVRQMGDYDLAERLEKTLDFSVDKKNLMLNIQTTGGYQIISPKDEINDLLLALAKKIDANTLYIATGFVFASGLELLSNVFDYIKRNSGVVEIISGSLYDIESEGNKSKIDRKSVRKLNDLIDQNIIKLLTYTESFYHGKFYYIGNGEKAYVIVGSTNVSKTAFSDNYELDVLFEIENKGTFLKWYEEFKNKCTAIHRIDESKFADFDWTSELDIYSERIVHKMTQKEVLQKISLTDEETQYRLALWMDHKPSEYCSNLGIKNLEDYVAFMYPEYNLVVLECFEYGQAYYVFHCADLNGLINQIAYLSKSQILKDKIYNVYHGIHIKDREVLKNKIDEIFKKM